MKLCELLSSDLIIPSLVGHNRDEILREVSAQLGNACSLDPEKVFAILSAREELGSTGIEEGLAIPHGKYPGLAKMLMCMARSTEGVEFAARDGKPTHLFVVLMAPENDAGAHLKTLARVSRLFKNPSFRDRLLEAEGGEEIAEIISEEDSRL